MAAVAAAAQEQQQQQQQQGEGGCRLEVVDVFYYVDDRGKGGMAEDLLCRQKCSGRLAGSTDGHAPKQKKKCLIEALSFELHSGQLCAVMGPSGAGKSTLLDILSGRKVGGSIAGDILVNDAPRPRHGFNREVAYVVQDDVHIRSLTVHQTLEFAARLRIPQNLSDWQYRDRVKRVASILGIFSCIHTRIGDPEGGGISGGQLRRLSIGVELIHLPGLLLLDEPTSGLDSSTALQVAQILRRLATKDRKTVVCSIHQPSREVFQLFDSVLLLVSGKLAYFGPIEQCLAHFNSIGFSVPQGANPAEFLLDSMTEAITSEPHNTARSSTVSVADYLAREFTESVYTYRPTRYGVKKQAPPMKVRSAPKSVPEQLVTLCTRSWLYAVSNFYMLPLVLVRNVLAALLLGGLYWHDAAKLRKSDIQDPSNLTFSPEAYNVASMLFMVIVVAVVSNVALLPEMFTLRRLYRREMAAGTYHPFALWLTMLFTFVPIFTLGAVIHAAILRAFVELRGDALLYYFGFVVVSLLGYAQAQAVAVWTPTPKGAFVAFTLAAIVSIILSGYLIPSPQMVPAWKWGTSLPFTRYVFQILMYIEFDEVKNGDIFLDTYGFKHTRVKLWSGILCMYFVLLELIIYFGLRPGHARVLELDGPLLSPQEQREMRLMSSAEVEPRQSRARSHQQMPNINKPGSRRLRASIVRSTASQHGSTLRGSNSTRGGGGGGKSIDMRNPLAQRKWGHSRSNTDQDGFTDEIEMLERLPASGNAAPPSAQPELGTDGGQDNGRAGDDVAQLLDPMEDPTIRASMVDTWHNAIAAVAESSGVDPLEDLQSVQKRHRVTLQFEDVSLSVWNNATRRMDKPLLRKISGHVEPGEMLAIMGPSGAGKTTLLNILAGRTREGASAGTVAVNGIRIECLFMDANQAYVMQTDAHYASLTVRESVQYAARLRLGDLVKTMQQRPSAEWSQDMDRERMSSIRKSVTSESAPVGPGSVNDVGAAADSEMVEVALNQLNGNDEEDGEDDDEDVGEVVSLEQRADEVLTLLGLQSVADQIIGPPGNRNISGGQLRRLSIAVELVHLPSLLFLDEPTSGLDSALANQVVESLRILADTKRTILCTIHQPSIFAYECFDKLLLLSDGYLVYFGPPSLAQQHFTQLGYISEMENPADFVLAAARGKARQADKATPLRPQDMAEMYQKSVVADEWKSQVMLKSQSDPGVRNYIDRTQRRNVQAVLRWNHCATLFSRQLLVLRRSTLFLKLSLGHAIGTGFIVGTLWYQIDDGEYTMRISLMAATYVNIVLGLAELSQSLFEDKKIFLREHQTGASSVLAYWLTLSLPHFMFETVMLLVQCALVYTLAGLHHGFASFMFLYLVVLVTYLCMMFFVHFVNGVVASPETSIAVFPGVTIPSQVLLSGFPVLLSTMDQSYKWVTTLNAMRWFVEALFINEFAHNPRARNPPGSNLVTYDVLADEYDFHETRWQCVSILVGMAIVWKVFSLLTLSFTTHRRRYTVA